MIIISIYRDIRNQIDKEKPLEVKKSPSSKQFSSRSISSRSSRVDRQRERTSKSQHSSTENQDEHVPNTEESPVIMNIGKPTETAVSGNSSIKATPERK